MHSNKNLPLVPPTLPDLGRPQGAMLVQNEQADQHLQANDPEYLLDFDAGRGLRDDFYDSLVVPNDENKENQPDEEMAEGGDYNAFDVPDDEIDLEELLAKMQVKTRSQKIMLLYATVFAIVGPLLFFTGAIQFPIEYEEFLSSLMELLWFTCRFTSEDIEAIAFDGTVVRLEAIRYTTTSAFVTILVAGLGAAYQGGKKCWKRHLMNELVELLEEKNVKNAGMLRSYEFSSEKMNHMIQSIRQHGVQRDLLEEIRENPSRLEQMARNIQSYRKELMRYFKIMLVGFAFPGLIIWMQKADSLSDKIDCDKSTVVLDTCPAEKQYAHLALLIYPWMTASFGALAVLSFGMLAYFFVPERYGRKFNEKIHQRILKFLSLRDEDKDKWAHREFVWALGYSASLLFLTWFSVTRAYNTANEFAALSNCPPILREWMAVITGEDISTPECTAAKATLIFGGGIANLEMDKFYPLYTIAEVSFYSLAILLTTFTPFRRMVSLDTIKPFLEKFQKVHETAMKAGAAGVLLVGVPLFYRALNYALPINRDGITEERRFDDLLLTNSSISFVNRSLADGIKEICPYDSINFLDQLKKISIGDLADSITYRGNSVFDFVITKGCPEFASYGGALVLFGLTLGNRFISCNQSTYIRFYSGFLAVYWSGISITFGALYLPVFYGMLAAWALRACTNKPGAVVAPAALPREEPVAGEEAEEAKEEAKEEAQQVMAPAANRQPSSQRVERHRFFAFDGVARTAVDDKKERLLEAEDQNYDDLFTDDDEELQEQLSSLKKASSSKKSGLLKWLSRDAAPSAQDKERPVVIEMHSSSKTKKASSGRQ
ncbi:MAG: hypothetical protein P4M14_11695 [Gammaproteobacteria bacterium]|nr:hypothetical protein [Gammaproteobacteria bacterium]